MSGPHIVGLWLLSQTLLAVGVAAVQWLRHPERRATR